jgi:hypothetical protein
MTAIAWSRSSAPSPLTAKQAEPAEKGNRNTRQDRNVQVEEIPERERKLHGAAQAIAAS